MSIEKGDIYYIENTRKIIGSEQAGSRPGIIVSNNIGNIHSEVVEVVWLTTADKNPIPTHVEVMCRVPSTALCEQISTVSVSRVGEFIRSCTDEEMQRIDNALMVSLGIKHDDLVTELTQRLSRADESFCDMMNDYALMKETLGKMESERAELLKQISYLEGSVNDSAITKRMQLELVKAQAERDLYKEQFERLIERMRAEA